MKLCFLLVMINIKESKNSRRVELLLNVLDVIGIANRKLRLYYVMIFVFCIKSFSLLYHYCILL